MKKRSIYLGILCTTLLYSCSVTKFVPDNEYLLDEVKVTTTNKDVNVSNLRSYIRQNPNARWFSSWRLPLHIYNLSGRDTTGWNKFLRKIGEEPVLYDQQAAMRTCDDLKHALQNLGYMGAYVNLDKEKKGKKLALTYQLHPGTAYRIKSYYENIDDPHIREYLKSWNSTTQPAVGMIMNVTELDQERQKITTYLQNLGYYKFNKEYISYKADTIRNTKEVHLRMYLETLKNESDKDQLHQQFHIRDVSFLTDFNFREQDVRDLARYDSLQRQGVKFFFHGKTPVRSKVMADNNLIQPGDLYKESNVQGTYNRFGRLRALKYTNIRFNEVNDSLLDCQILTSPAKSQSLTAEVEGTNTAGDLGAAASLGYQHRNLFRGSELFSFKVRGAYEAITGLEGYSDSDYKEWGVEASLNFPRFMFPFLNRDFRRSIQATSEVKLQLNSQIRPEFSRRVASAGWSYRWNHKYSQHKVDVLDFNYIYMPRISEKFKHEYLDSITNQNAILKYNYEDLLILKMGYSYSFNSSGMTTNQYADTYSLRFNIESAGNLLYGLSKMVKGQTDMDGRYTLADIAYAQYVKGDFDYAKNFVIDDRNSIVAHIGVGIAYPYGNSKILPFEKRYFSGGANNVRGWGVRTLGPGSYRRSGSSIDFINQSGDIKIDMNLEYRTHLFWKLDGALFVDAGNIWTIRNYEDQPGGQFKFDKFYKQIAVAYGMGIRFNFDYFILRFDGGMKAINPEYESGREHYPIIHPKLSRDFAFHFSVGYPF